MVKRPVRKPVAPTTVVTKTVFTKEKLATIDADDLTKAKADFLRKTELAHIHYAKRAYDLAMQHNRAVMAIREEWRSYITTQGAEQIDGDGLDDGN